MCVHGAYLHQQAVHQPTGQAQDQDALPHGAHCGKMIKKNNRGDSKQKKPMNVIGNKTISTIVNEGVCKQKQK